VGCRVTRRIATEWRGVPHFATACADEDNVVQEQELTPVWRTRTVQIKLYGKTHFPIAQGGMARVTACRQLRTPSLSAHNVANHAAAA
jgi:hypothetical protein